MELIKKPFKIGNSAAVLIPKKWANEKIIVKPLKKSIIKDVIDILSERDLLSDVKGIYLTGSYARGEHDTESDIDILVITNNNSGIITEGNYEIILTRKDIIDKNLPKRLYLLSMIKEAEPLINKSLIDKYKKIKQKINIKEHKKEIKSILNINKESIEFAEDYNEKLLDGTAYSLVLRLRELYLINCLIKNKKPNKKELLNKIPKSIYEGYLRVKRNKKNLDNIDKKDVEIAYNLSKRWLKELKD